MKRTRTSKAWMMEHVNDPYVQLAKKEGWRSRAAFKLMEIDDKDKLLKRGEVVVDLGATPGGWSQVAVKRVGDGGLVFALDLLENKHVLLAPGSSFNVPYHDRFRITLLPDWETMNEVLGRIEELLQELARKPVTAVANRA